MDSTKRIQPLLGCLVSLMGCLNVGAAEPTTAIVKPGGAKVLAGPGTHYYEAAELPAGSQVQIYQQTENGFCAVRPPEGSFSWVPASSVRMLSDGLGEVVRANAPSRVGSLLHQRRDAVHVRLNQGERVQVLSESNLDGVAWLQIAPPAGEFRWIHVDQLADPADKQPASTADSGWVETASHEDETPPAIPAEATVTGVKAAPSQLPDAASVTPPNATLGSQSTAPVALPPGEFGQRLAALEIALGRQVAELPTLWQLDTLEQQAASLLSTASNEQERTAVRSFATRIDRFAALQTRYKSVRSGLQGVQLTKTTVPNPPVVQGEVTRLGADVAGFDAVGTLRPVVSKRPGAPQFALVDGDGKIVSFVTSTTGMNLTPLVGQRVGVSGSKGFMPEYQQPHLTAGRVTPLSPRLR